MESINNLDINAPLLNNDSESSPTFHEMPFIDSNNENCDNTVKYEVVQNLEINHRT